MHTSRCDWNKLNFSPIFQVNLGDPYPWCAMGDFATPPTPNGRDGPIIEMRGKHADTSWSTVPINVSPAY